ncbi:MAG: hypothetical protein WCJ18_08845, partial [Planctomycetota bacterium]
VALLDATDETLAAAALDELVRPLGIIHARGKPLPPTAQRFVELLRGHAHDIDVAAAETPSNTHVAHS